SGPRTYLSFLLLILPPPTSTLFPYTTLFRSPLKAEDHPQAKEPHREVQKIQQEVHQHHARIVGVENALPYLAFRDDPEGQVRQRSEEHTSELQSRSDLVCRLLLEKKKKTKSI